MHKCMTEWVYGAFDKIFRFSAFWSKEDPALQKGEERREEKRGEEKTERRNQQWSSDDSELMSWTLADWSWCNLDECPISISSLRQTKPRVRLRLDESVLGFFFWPEANFTCHKNKKLFWLVEAKGRRGPTCSPSFWTGTPSDAERRDKETEWGREKRGERQFVLHTELNLGFKNKC